MCDECTEYAWEASAKDERERIIKLLEEQFSSSYWSDLSPEFVIALIKGEN